MLCVEFPQVRYVDLRREILHVLNCGRQYDKCTLKHLNFVVSHFLNAEVSP